MFGAFCYLIAYRMKLHLQPKSFAPLIVRSHSLSSPSPSTSSSSSSYKTSCDVLIQHSDCAGEEDFDSLDTKSFTELQSLSNKENILHSDSKVKKSDRSMTKMPPTSTKLPGRQTNNSLSSITGQIVIQTSATSSPVPPPGPSPSTSRKKKAKPEVWVELFLFM